ncbi:family 43 glycosylhydrolase [Roseateles cellulosilyticus]|uniref:Family 43 glycosylhydrolase n=1 Tax=Pelomonas cellulosilytica TaxID=2906762 RepID=A0ABS8XLZ4_9BURK|nr:family 43 glycosylhydrolase [Pelomonas sp. P8]MCE4553811.1 family 43 glycosylhydrolase [Pelomonas sp. P8]
MPCSLRQLLALGFAAVLQTTPAWATNPLIMDQFTADPTARVFNGKVYVYPSHDIKAPPDYQGKPDWFVMPDYHVFSSDNLTDWKDHGVIVSQSGVDWVDPTAYAMWAPDCVYKDGKYYFYFPAIAKKDANAGGDNKRPEFRIGVAVADKPEGPFKPLSTYIPGVRGIDPNVLIDKDGTAYLYYSAGRIYVARLKPNMTEIDGEPRVIDNLPTQGLVEGPFAFERNGIYYLTYPHVAHKIERLEYAMSTSPLGPFKHAGVILDESESGCWTVHHSILDWQGQSYLFYHDRDLSPHFDKNRSIRADKLFFNPDGTIQKVIPTLRGVGLVRADGEIQIDRFSAKSTDGVAVSFLDDAHPQAGWKTTFSAEKSWVKFNDVDFGQGGQKSIQVRAKLGAASTLELHLDRPDGPLLGRVEIDKPGGWQTFVAPVSDMPRGVRDLVVTQARGAAVEVDWVRFR